MYRCLNGETADSTKDASKLTYGIACGLGNQAPTAASALAQHRSAAASQPMDHCLDEESPDSTQAATKLARGTACSLGQQTPTAALALAPHRSAAAVAILCQ